VFADATVAATTARSAHVVGRLESDGRPLTLDLFTVRGKGATGSASRNGLRFDIVRIADTVYIRGSNAFLKRFANAAVAQLLRGRWLKAPATRGRLSSLARLTSLGALFAGIRSRHGKLVNRGTTTYAGQQVVAIRDTSDGSTLYVAALGQPYPVAIVGGRAGQSGTITFDDWNASVSLAAPKNAIDLSDLGG
jgi:hypothetical protein